MVLIYTTNPSARLAYILDEIFTRRAELAYAVTTDREAYLQSADLRINYSAEDMPGIRMRPSGLLEETGIRKDFTPPHATINEMLLLFPNDSETGADLFSMAFWYLSRYEEYGFRHADVHGRFTTASSVLHGISDPRIPALDAALNRFCEHCGIPLKNKFGIYPTFDIDMAWKYRGKPLAVSLGGWVRDALSGRLTEVFQRAAVWLGKTDPYDVYDEMERLLNPVKDRVRLFFLAGKRGRYDKNVSPGQPAFQALIRRLAAQFETGIHPSYQSPDQPQFIQNEKNKLEAILQKPVTRSRQHYLRMRVPATWRHLSACGIVHDYTMGFAGSSGFRAGTGHSFHFYDLGNEAGTPLIIHPFCVMDVSLKNYMGLTAEMAAEHVTALKNTCKTHGSPFCFIFHNESMSDSGEWKGWKKVLETCLK